MISRILKTLLLISVLLLTVSFSRTEKRHKAPDFALQTQDGKVIELSKLKGKVVLINFWATWCPPCRAEIPDFVEVYKMYKSKGFEIIGIALDVDGWNAVTPYIKKEKINYPVVLGTQTEVNKYGGFEAIPTSFIIDKNGFIVEMQTGFLQKEELEKKINTLLK